MLRPGRRKGSEERIRDFVAQGILMNVLLSMRAPEHLDEEGAGRAVAPFTVCVFGDALAFVTGPPGPPGPRGAHH